MTTLVVETGTANLASVMAALHRAGAEPRLTRDARAIASAERVVLPGVGAFGAAMESLRAHDLVDVLRARVTQGQPTMAICLGLQLFAESSAESPGVTGLGLVKAQIARFSGEDGVRVPELGWNAVEVESGAGALSSGFAYYAHSYFLPAAPEGWRAAWSTHGERFVGAIERGRVLACQFHPELSGAWGASLIARWLKGESADATAGEARKRAAPRVIPCLDVKDGRVVKGVRFQGLRDAGDPVALALAYEAQGADELVLLDVSATPEGRQAAHVTVAAVRRGLSIPLTVGGGVRSAEDAGRLLDAGADKVGVNTAAVDRPALIDEIATRFGRQCAVLALDAASTGAQSWEVVTHSGKTRTAKDAVAWRKKPPSAAPARSC